MISATGRQRGFSLLELLVVIVIVGLLSAAVVLSVPGDRADSQLRRFAEQTVARLRLASDEAVFTGRTMGLLWGVDEGRFMVRSADGWQRVGHGQLADPVSIPADINLRVEVQGSVIDPTEAETPQILFLNDGQVSPFDIYLEALDTGRRIHFDDNLTLEPAS